MKISAIIDYSATPDEVFAMLIDEDFQNRKCVATGATSHTVAITAREDRTIIVCRREMPADDEHVFALDALLRERADDALVTPR